MRSFKIILIVLTLFFVSMAISEAAKNKPDDSDWYAQIWDNAVEFDYSNQLLPIFKSIEHKNQKEFIPALDRFLTIRRRNSPHRAQAIYTLSKLGSKYSEEDFNLLLRDKTHFETELWPKELQEKYKALRDMSELDLSVSSKAVRVIKTDIATVLNLKYPFHAINLIAGLKLNGIEMTDKEKIQISDIASKHWRGIRPEELKLSGIQLDWQWMIQWELKNKEFYRRKTNEILNLMLISSDEELRKEYAIGLENEPLDNDQHLAKLVNLYRRIAAATLGNEEAVQSLIENMHIRYFTYTEPVVDLLPDELLLAMLAFEDADPRHNDIRFIVELMNRGYEKEVNDFLDNREKFARESYVSYKRLEHRNPQPDQERIRALFPIYKIDPNRYFNIVWDIFQENPQNRYFAQQFTEYRSFGRKFEESSERADWMIDNPEKLVMVIKFLLESKIPVTAKMKRDQEVGLMVNSPDYGNHSMAVTAMIWLPESTFEENFSRLDRDVMTSSAYLVGNHFKAKWAYKKDQQKFHNRYGWKVPGYLEK